MRLTPAKALALTLLVAFGPLAMPRSGAVSIVEAAPLVPNGSTAYQAVAPYRLADTRPDQGVGGFSDVTEGIIRVQVAGRGPVPLGASAAVLNVTGVNSTGPGFVTVYPAGTGLPTASNINFDQGGQVIANMVTVKLSPGGAVDIYTQQPLDLVVDVSGVYMPVNTAVRGGRLKTLEAGAYRAFDSRTRGFAVAARSVERVDVAAVVPADATAVVVNVTATETGVGFWTAYPLGDSPPNASNINIDTPGQTRAGQAIVLLAGVAAFNVYSQGGGQLIIDVAGYFTGASADQLTEGLFYPNPPIRLIDTRAMFTMPTWGGSTLEVPVYNPPIGPVSAVAVNLTGTQSMIGGFVTAFPAGVERPEASNLNFDTWDQTVANHAIVRVSNRGMSLYTLQGLHMIADLSGWYLGPPSAATLPVPTNPVYNPNTAQSLNAGAIGLSTAVGTGSNLDAVANLGIAATWNGTAEVAVPGNIVLFGHRTSHGAPFLYIDRLNGTTISLIGADGHSYNYVVVRIDVTSPNFNVINNIGLRSGLATVQLVACTPPHSVKFRLVTTARLVSVT